MWTSDPTVFIVDDDDAFRDAAGKLLRAYGFKSEAFASAEDFLDQFDPSRVGCLLLDLQMPGMDGVELQSELRRRNIPIPIIFITGNAQVPTAVSNMTAGAVDLLEKPFPPQELISAIERAFGQ